MEQVQSRGGSPPQASNDRREAPRARPYARRNDPHTIWLHHGGSSVALCMAAEKPEIVHDYHTPWALGNSICVQRQVVLLEDDSGLGAVFSCYNLCNVQSYKKEDQCQYAKVCIRGFDYP